jgi:hypothetical protein
MYLAAAAYPWSHGKNLHFSFEVNLAKVNKGMVLAYPIVLLPDNMCSM